MNTSVPQGGFIWANWTGTGNSATAAFNEVNVGLWWDVKVFLWQNPLQYIGVRSDNIGTVSISGWVIYGSAC